MILALFLMPPNSYQSSCSFTKKNSITRDIPNYLKIKINSSAYYYVFKRCLLFAEVQAQWRIWLLQFMILKSFFSSVLIFFHISICCSAQWYCVHQGTGAKIKTLLCSTVTHRQTCHRLFPVTGTHTHDATVEMYSQPGVCSTDLTPGACIS